MIFERFEPNGLSHFSYAVGCQRAGRVAICDPQRDIDVYLRWAESEGVTISDVIETHIHADYASGAKELADETGARLALSAYDAGEQFDVSYPHRELGEGDVVEIGAVRIEALHTPGHTPEHLAFLVYDGARSTDVPELMLSGDFLFVGSIGRPDLLGEEETRGLAKAMFRSVREKLTGLPDGLEIHPAHGAGSMCGAGMSGRPMSTLGFERAANAYLDPSLTEERFLDMLLGSVPPFPPYYRRMKRLNADGPPALRGMPGLDAVAPRRFRTLLDEGYVAIDLRPPSAYGGDHVPGAFSIALAPPLSTWAAWVVPYETPILLIGPDDSAPAAISEAVRALVRVGLDDVAGYLRGGMTAWHEEGLPVARTAQISPAELHGARESGTRVALVDVRSDGEWDEAHVAGALHIPGGALAERIGEIPRDTERIAVICGSGYRSSVATSVLERAGLAGSVSVANVAGGMTAWRNAGLPVTSG